MVAPKAGFRGGTLYRPKYRSRPKKIAYQSVGFRSQKKKKQTNGVTPKLVTPGACRPPPLATPLGE